MKDTKAWAAVDRESGQPWFGSLDLRRHAIPEWARRNEIPPRRYSEEPVVIVSAERYAELIAHEAGRQAVETEGEGG